MACVLCFDVIYIGSTAQAGRIRTIWLMGWRAVTTGRSDVSHLMAAGGSIALPFLVFNYREGVRKGEENVVITNTVHSLLTSQPNIPALTLSSLTVQSILEDGRYKGGESQKGPGEIIDICLVNFEEDFLPRHEFYFTPENVAPTVHQKFPNLVTDTVLITGEGDAPLLDGRYNWIIDSGSTFYMTNNKTLFSDFQERESKVITAGKAVGSNA